MEFEPILDSDYINQAWTEPCGCKLVKSHEWSYHIDKIREKFPNDWIIMVYRPDMISYAWWHEAGGFQIKYPKYDNYKNSSNILNEIMQQNASMLKFGMLNNCKWEYFNSEWIKKHFNEDISVNEIFLDILITIIK